MGERKYVINHEHKAACALTPRQLQVLCLMAHDLLASEIAAVMHVKEQTVRNYQSGVSPLVETKIGRGIYGIFEREGVERGWDSAVMHAISIGLLKIRK